MTVLKSLREQRILRALRRGLTRTSLRSALPAPFQPILAARAARKWSEQDSKMAAFYGDFLRYGDLVFDVGANIGNRTKVFLYLGCRVIAVEPQAFCLAVLKKAFDRRITIVNCAVSDSVGLAEFHVGDSHELSSMSKDFIKRTSECGRFAEHRWDKTTMVETTTLDTLCGEYGRPAFIKIDVEGHEQSVLRGLSVPIPLLSFEFAAETLEATYFCLARLEQIESYRYNYSMGESMELRLTQWVSLSDIKMHLSQIATTHAWGDVYAKLK
jgi:FkbM family methyltransferase